MALGCDCDLDLNEAVVVVAVADRDDGWTKKLGTLLRSLRSLSSLYAVASCPRDHWRLLRQRR